MLSMSQRPPAGG